ncbi:c-type cytochrome [Falsiroseomonas sp.]|uniref:c-type cytochrome n=1 Tax=Falsiroseomonas sp. TaxID=2870721 RepID=UPI00356B3CE2
MRKVAITVVAVLAVEAAVAAAWIYSGFYPIAATQQHLPITYAVIETAYNRSIARYAASVGEPPDLAQPGLLPEGLRHYQDHCAQCHGAPGVAPAPFSLGMTPVPPPIVGIARHRTPAQIFWVIKHGVKMSGMLGWELKLEDAEIWAIVALVTRMPTMTPIAYQEMVRSFGVPPPEAACPTVAAAARSADAVPAAGECL